MADKLAEAFGIVNIHKLKGNGAKDPVVVHSECARSQSNDSGVVADIDQEGDAESVRINALKGHDQGKCKLSVITDEPVRFSSDICNFEMNGNIPEFKRTDSLCERTSLNGHVILEENEHDQSQETIHADIESDCTSLPSSPKTPSATDSSRQNSQSCETVKCVKCAQKCSGQLENTCQCSITDSKSNNVTASCPRKLDLRQLDLSLGIQTMAHHNRTIYESHESDEMPERRRHRSQRAATTAKQSWLLRLFESKLFDMSIAITYLFNSKEPGVQTYIGKFIAAVVTEK